MHVLTIIDHPNPNSFTHALAQAFCDGAQSASHSIEIADLHAEGFNPVWSMADINADAGANSSADVIQEQARIERADAICMAFPLFWWGMPAMMKGWVDRVWSYGWAYDQVDDPEISLQRHRTGVLLVPAGARSDEMERKGYTDALQTMWLKGTFGYFGCDPRKLALLQGSTGSPERRECLLARSYELAKTLLPPKETA